MWGNYSMNIKVTGDCHGDFKRFSKKSRAHLGINEGDIIIQCGDLGLLWCKDKEFEYNLDFFSNITFTLLWVGGNHENYNMLKEYPLEEWNGGLVRHIVRNKVIYLERGQVFNIDGKTFFTMGGASSNDIKDGILDRNSSDFKDKLKRLRRLKKKHYRIVNESWWEDELPSNEEIEAAMSKLESIGNKVDYIITHCCSSEVEELIGCKNHDRLTDFFNYIERFVDFKRWYFGHNHQDVTMYDEKHTIVYKRVIDLEE